MAGGCYHYCQPIWDVYFSVGCVDCGGQFPRIHVIGNHAYVTAFAGAVFNDCQQYWCSRIDEYVGLLVFDVSNPVAPVRVGSYRPNVRLAGIYVSNDLAYATDSRGGLQVLGLAEPNDPIPLGH